MFSLAHRIPRLAALGAIAALACTAALPLMAFAAAPSTCDLACVQQFGNTQIGNRLTVLTTLNGKVQTALNDKRISSDQANALFTDISTNDTGLKNLQSTLDGEKTESAARQDVKNIYLQFRIYAVVLPRDYRTLYLDRIIDVHDKLAALHDKIRDAISKAPAGEQAQLNSLFDDYNNQLQSTESQIDAARGELPQLTPENFNNNKASEQQA
ncbi:MAG: hypothetical protein ACHQ4H_02005, partial [Ktedonobacterales bacterium]